MIKFDWVASESAPKNFPMEIVQGHFYAEDDSSLYIPNGSYINNGWGEVGSSHIVGDDTKTLPNRLDITFFSYVENQFYRGSFDLPYADILLAFKTRIHNHQSNTSSDFRYIIAGVAPGGAVSVWLSGPGKKLEVFFGYAEKIDLPWRALLDNDAVSRDAYVNDVLKYAIKQTGIDRLKLEGIPFGIWEAYRQSYFWRLNIRSQNPPNNAINVWFFNGEKLSMDYSGNVSEAGIDYPVPKKISITWPKKPGETYSAMYTFDEQEVLRVFQLQQKGMSSGEPLPPVNVELYLQEDGAKRRLSASVSLFDESIVLQKTEVEALRAR